LPCATISRSVTGFRNESTLAADGRQPFIGGIFLAFMSGAFSHADKHMLCIPYVQILAI
jgi:hypothetical protein